MTQNADVGDGLTAISEHHRNVDQHPAPVVDRDESPPCHRLRQSGGEPDPISQKTRRDGPGMRNHPDTISGDRQTGRPRSTLHLPSAFCLRNRSSDKNQFPLIRKHFDVSAPGKPQIPVNHRG